MGREKWLPVVGWKGYYEVSDLGRVRSLDRVVRCGYGATRIFRGRTLSLTPNTEGYLRVAIGVNRKFKTIVVHRLVAIAFIPNPLQKKYVNHKDGIKANPKKSNLEWATRSEDSQHAHDTGLNRSRFSAKQKMAAAANGRLSRGMSEAQVRRARELRAITGYGSRRLAAILGVTSGSVGSVIYRRRYADVN